MIHILGSAHSAHVGKDVRAYIPAIDTKSDGINIHDVHGCIDISKLVVECKVSQPCYPGALVKVAAGRRKCGSDTAWYNADNVFVWCIIRPNIDCCPGKEILDAVVQEGQEVTTK